MVNEISCIAKSKNNIAKYVLLGLLGTSLILVCAANLTPKYSGIVWIFALGFITATIYVYNRYVGSEYCYSVTDDYGRPTLTVSMRIGKTARVLARLDLYTIREVKMLTLSELKSYKCEKGVIKYPYYPTMRPESVLLVSVRSEHENADVLIEVDSEFASALEASL